MKSKAAIAFSAGESLSIEAVDLEGPKSGEVLIEVIATGVCHTDAYTLSGGDPEGLFPSILGHEGLEVEDLLGALLDAVLVEGRAGHDLGLELVVELRHELRAELLLPLLEGAPKEGVLFRRCGEAQRAERLVLAELGGCLLYTSDAADE